MEPSADALFEAAVKLPENERLALVSRLLQTMPDEPIGLSLDDPGLLEELNRRSSETDKVVPWSQVLADLEGDA